MELGKRKNENKVESTIDLMDGLMQIEDGEGDKLSDKEVVDNIVSLVIGGYMSTSLSSMWAIYLLAKHPIVLKKLRVCTKFVPCNHDFKFMSCIDLIIKNKSWINGKT